MISTILSWIAVVIGSLGLFANGAAMGKGMKTSRRALLSAGACLAAIIVSVLNLTTAL